MGFFTALAFLTTIPTPRPGQAVEVPQAGVEAYARSVPYFPLVGLLLGLILVGLDYVLGLAFQPLAVSALLIAATLLLTGALHLEGLIDSCDGLLCAKSPEQRLEIMKDSRAGAFGVAGAGAILILRFAALASLPAGVRPQALLLAPILSRWAMAYAMAAFPYGRRGPGLGSMFKDYLKPRDTIYASILALVAVVAISQLAGLLAFAIAILATWLVARFALSRIPGLTGDVYGAINELVELAILLLLPAFLVRSA